MSSRTAMTRDEILEEFDVSDATGIIRNPGKFEGEMLYVPYFWDKALQGAADRDDGKVFGFDISLEEKAMFPELGKRRRTVKLYQREDGFVCEL